MMKKIVLFVMIISSILVADEFHWPDNCTCAVSLTFDDNLNSQLNIAIPMLDKAGLNGTFYSVGNAASLSKRMDEWRIAAANGHELGNHTLFHPCLENTRGEKRTWLAEYTKLENYSIDRIVDELKVANTLLQAIDGKTERTFAYT